MRGSPVMRTIILLMAVILSGLGFSKLMHTPKSVIVIPPAIESVGDTKRISTKIQLSLSHPVDSIALSLGEQDVPLERVSATRYEANLELDFSDTAFFLTTKSLPSTGAASATFFAKLVIEAQSKKTFTHTFDSLGDMDDFIEYPF